MPEPTPAAARRLRTPRMRRPGFWGLAAGVVLLHLLLSNHLLENRVGWGSGPQAPPRIDVTFVQELKATAPPPLAAAAPAAPAEKRLPAVAAQPQAAASAPRSDTPAAAEPGNPQAAVAATTTAPGPELLASVAEPAPAASTAVDARAAPSAPSAGVAVAAPELPAAASASIHPSAPAQVAQAAASPAAPAASAAAFDWPPSTRLSYALTGDYRGPVNGSATVEWLRQGNRYQVHLETSVGPVLSRHITSEGELTTQGLAPQRFDGEQKVLFRAAQRWQLRFGPERVVLRDGREMPTLAGVQDEASQFVQLTWLFTTQPERLKVGQSIEMPLAISRKVERWTYDIVAEETLRFPFGAVATFHIKPRREAQGGDLTPEIWIAPTLQYLPVRILIRDGKSHWIDLSLEKPPLQAAAPPAVR
jgi:Protein of unknown function (DUF3108)